MNKTGTSTSQFTTLNALNSARVGAIDIIRALTMVLMIFVNDLWSLTHIPGWLEHVPPGVDGIGLADVVFPAFLFIVGMSLPFAVDNRRKKGDNTRQLVGHVLLRSVALLTMGLWLVNGESINETATGLSRLLWNVLSCTSFILIWNSYPKTAPKALVTGLKAAGILTLLVLAVIYRGGESEKINRFEPQWWGILGLIGWSYLVAALVTVFARNRLVVLVAAWFGFAGLSLVAHANLLPEALNFIPGAIRNGTLVGLSMGGVVTATLFRYYRRKADNQRMILLFAVMAIVLIGLSMMVRPYWGLAKLGETPAWLFLCSAFTLLAFMLIYWMADIRGQSRWFSFVRPAGTDTLLCYLLPYFAYATTAFLGIHLPEVLLTGGIGLLKSFLFALLCVWITGLLSRAGIRLKL
ncbi:lpg1661 family Dot/Icm T4SS effector [Larkinella ripae]